jgi:hypothetical protein
MQQIRVQVFFISKNIAENSAQSNSSPIRGRFRTQRFAERTIPSNDHFLNMHCRAFVTAGPNRDGNCHPDINQYEEQPT